MVAVREGLKNFSYNLWIGNFVLDSMLGAINKQAWCVVLGKGLKRYMNKEIIYKYQIKIGNNTI